MQDSQSREPGFASPLLPFRSLTFSFYPRRLSPLCCINEYLTIDGGGNVTDESPRVIAAWLECFQKRRVGVGMDRSVTGVNCKVL